MSRENMPTKERIAKVREVLSRRQPDLRVVLENIAITHNASAVIRTCDAAGILDVDIISTGPEPLLVNKAISTRAEKWVRLHTHASTRECLSALRKKGFKIAVTCLGEGSMLYSDLDYAQKLALVFGNESDGVTADALNLADYRIKIPMVGMVRSLNLSVSVGIVLFEAFTKRSAKGFYGRRRLPPREFAALFREWLKIPDEE